VLDRGDELLAIARPVHLLRDGQDAQGLGSHLGTPQLDRVTHAASQTLQLVGQTHHRLRVRDDLAQLGGGRIGAQVTAQPAFDPQRLLVMTRELEEFVRAMQGDAASAPTAAERGEKG
jgi:hypothetical protein